MNDQTVANADLVATLKDHPNIMVVTNKFVAVYHSELDMTILIPGHFVRMSDKAALQMLNANLQELNASPIS